MHSVNGRGPGWRAGQPPGLAGGAQPCSECSRRVENPLRREGVEEVGFVGTVISIAVSSGSSSCRRGLGWTCALSAAHGSAPLASCRLRPAADPDLPLQGHPAALALPLKFTPLSTFTIRLRFKARAVRKAWMAYRTNPR